MIRVCVVDDDEMVVDAIRWALRHEPDFQVLGMYSATDDFSTRADDIDIVLLNIDLPNHGAMNVVTGLNSIEGTPRVVLTGVQCPETELIPFLEKGIAGYVPAGSTSSAFVETLRMIHRGEVLLSPRLAAALMQRLVLLSRAYDRARLLDPEVLAVRMLTSRECDVIELVGRGFSNQEIAEHVNIEVGTVKNHVHNILRKLDVSSRRAAAAKYSRVQRKHDQSDAPVDQGPSGDVQQLISDDNEKQPSTVDVRRLPA